MTIYSYVITQDTGFAPNPFWGYCTIANCKPAIRRTANKGDWIVGLSTKSKGNKVVYAMEVNEILSFHEYFKDKRFRKKRPDFSKEAVINKSGDNIYQPLSNNTFKQLQSLHSNGTKEHIKNKNHDLSGKNVLISTNFHYFGSKAVELPDELNELKVGRGHKSKFSILTISNFIDFILSQKRGIVAPPTKWPKDDFSWRITK